MKLFLCTWGNNYGLDCCIIAAKDFGSAYNIAKADRRVWDGFEINEIETPEEEGIIPIDFYNNFGG